MATALQWYAAKGKVMDMIPESQYVLRCVIRWLVVTLAVIAAIVLFGLLQQKNTWGWIIAYWSILTVKNILDIFKW